ncbi:diguanylate cyclase [Gorillibacterium sp. sgz5001074]|uniref:diguanylate cyclase n=1 Tax=Gorillibacterium sp. sgz5001074 TaxID=3446695 RepID=UPI003F67ED9E
MIVDDVPNNLRLLKDILEDEGYEVAAAEHGRKALELASLFCPHAILLDIMMPDLDGYEICKRLKEEPNTSDIPILMVTAKTDSLALKKALELGAFDFIKKPIDEVEVIARVQSALRLKEREDLLKVMASKDGLTGVYNHALLMEWLSKELAKLPRTGGCLSYIMMDIDHFKGVNDTYGHQAGDQILKGLTRLVETSIRGSDILGRYGGEEFGLILPETPLDEAVQVGNKLRKIIETHPFHSGSIPISITISMGIAAVNHGGAGREAVSLIEQADKALYEAKRRGRNRVEFILD